MHRTIEDVIPEMIEQNQWNWDDVFPHTIFAYNTAVHSKTTFSPFFLMFLREPTVNIQLILKNSSPGGPNNLDEFTDELCEKMRSAYALVQERVNCSSQTAEKRCDHRVRSVIFIVAQYVCFYYRRRRVKLGRKWQLMTDGPFRMIRT